MPSFLRTGEYCAKRILKIDGGTCLRKKTVGDVNSGVLAQSPEVFNHYFKFSFYWLQLHRVMRSFVLCVCVCVCCACIVSEH